MSDLEEKGYLYHPHTSAGRIPTDLAYRVYVDYLMRPPVVAPAQAQHLRGELEGQRAAVETILSRAAQVLGVLTNELGVAVTADDRRSGPRSPRSSTSLNRKLPARARAAQRRVRTIFVEVPAELAPDAVQKVTIVLNERLAGLTLKEIRATLADRLRDAGPSEPGRPSCSTSLCRKRKAVRRPDRTVRHGAGAPGEQPSCWPTARILDAGAAAGTARGDGAARPAARRPDGARRRRTHDHESARSTPTPGCRPSHS